MLVREGEARSSATDRRLAFSLAAIAGALNAAGFYAVGLYSSNMSGNVSALADHLALGSFAVAAVYLAVVAAFIAGAAASTLLINLGRRRFIRGIYAYSILAEAVLLVGLGCAELWLPEVRHGPAGAAGLSFILGLQNATVTRVSGARVRTTHVTGMVTDLGIEFANLLDPSFRGSGLDARANRDGLALHGLTVLAFLAGGVIGVLSYRASGALLLLGAAALLAILALPGAWSATKPDRLERKRSDARDEPNRL